MSPLCALLLVVAVSAVQGDADCTLEPESGMCLAYFPSYFFNSTSGQCEHFVYGGCGGNNNRFESKKECEVVCGRREEVDCAARPEVGLCKAAIPRFYYDADSRECKRFIYGGCGGNTNNFHNLQECNAQCAVEVPKIKEHDCSSPAETGLCEALFHRFYFNSETGRCERFVYGGCGGNGNNYQTAEQCQAVCGESVVEERDEPEETDCSSPAETGMCRGNFPAYFFNTESRKCELFTYGGCGGNGNKYGDEEECIDKCGDHEKESVDCESEPETGFCRAYIPMFYFDQSTGRCQHFVFGGCGGNKNKFVSEDECMSKCSS